MASPARARGGRPARGAAAAAALCVCASALLLCHGAGAVSPASSRILEEVEQAGGAAAAAAAAAAPAPAFDPQGAARPRAGAPARAHAPPRARMRRAWRKRRVPPAPCALPRAGAALLEFARGLQDPSEALLTWTADTHPCGGAAGTASGAGAVPPRGAARDAARRPWPGVSCDAPLGSVVGLDLAGRGLRGELGASLAVLDTLRSM
jgi:hypothetical protein